MASWIKAATMGVGMALAPFGVVAQSASEPGVVVELFTSQGCSSCPPADRMLSELAEEEGVIALALHVDYWDYIGWKDLFAQPKFTKRQKAYAHAVGKRMIYTPQVVIGGTDQVVGAKPMSVTKAIAAHLAQGPRAAVSLTREGGDLRIRAASETELGPVTVYLVRFRPRETVEVTRGENRGKTLTYTNIVTHWDTVAEWDGASELRLEVAVPETEPVAVILQEPQQGAIVAAAQIRP